MTPYFWCQVWNYRMSGHSSIYIIYDDFKSSPNVMNMAEYLVHAFVFQSVFRVKVDYVLYWGRWYCLSWDNLNPSAYLGQNLGRIVRSPKFSQIWCIGTLYDGDSSDGFANTYLHSLTRTWCLGFSLTAMNCSFSFPYTFLESTQKKNLK